MGLQLSDNNQVDRDAFRPLGNGKLVALGKVALPILLSVVGAYLTADRQTQAAISDTRQQIAVAVERENNHFLELKSELRDTKEELRLLRQAVMERTR